MSHGQENKDGCPEKSSAGLVGRHVANSQPAGEGLGNLFTDLPEDLDWNSLKTSVSLQEMGLFLAYFLDTLGNKIISHLFSVIFLIILILIGFSFKKIGV